MSLLTYIFLYLFIIISVATRILCVTRNQKIPGSTPERVAVVWKYTGGG